MPSDPQVHVHLHRLIDSSTWHISIFASTRVSFPALYTPHPSLPSLSPPFLCPRCL